MQLTKRELEARRKRFCQMMEQTFPNWDTCLIVSKVQQYYFTGSMQDALLIINSDGKMGYFVRKSYERAQRESPICEIYPMKSYRNAAEQFGKNLGNCYIEGETMPFNMYERIKKYFDIENTYSCDTLLRMQRAVKTPYELYWMEECGKKHQTFMEDVVPSLFSEGMSEAQLYGKMQSALLEMGYQGITRFYGFQTEMQIGQLAFGKNSIVSTSFDGPGGNLGAGPYASMGGNQERLLLEGDLVLVDIAFGIQGYHTDKTQIFSFGKKQDDDTLKAHAYCIEIQNKIASLLKTGNIPSQIYAQIMSEIEKENPTGFMGTDAVKFLGHGIGLYIDDFPVIAKGFDMPLEQNMTFAIEPKIALQDKGLVGVEETYVVTDLGGKCITGGAKEIVIVE